MKLKKAIATALTAMLVLSVLAGGASAAAPGACNQGSFNSLLQLLCGSSQFSGYKALQEYWNKYLAACKPVTTPAPAKPVVTPAPTKPPVTSPTAPVTPAPTQPVDTAPVDNLTYEEQVAALVNKERAANGLAALKLNAELSRVARAKSQDMRDRKYFSHTSPTYGSPFDMMRAFGITYRTAGENIAMGYATPQAVVTAWMNSPGHRANILNASYTQIGVGYVASGHYWTQHFIG